MPNCPRCGRAAQPNATFCAACGAGLAAQTPGNVPPPPPGGFQQGGFQPAAQSGGGDSLAMWAHLAPLLMTLAGTLLSIAGIGLLMGFLLWLPPLLIMNSSNASGFTKSHARESLNFQLFWLIMSVPLLIVGFFVVAATLGLGLAVVLPGIIALGIFVVVVMIIASVKASNGQAYSYPLVLFRLVKS